MYKHFWILLLSAIQMKVESDKMKNNIYWKCSSVDPARLTLKPIVKSVQVSY